MNEDGLEILLRELELKACFGELGAAAGALFETVNGGLARLNATIEKGLEKIERAGKKA